MKDAGPTGVYVVVDDVDAHHRRAVEHGAEILMPPTDQDYGSRDYMARDVEGNVWSFGTYAPETRGLTAPAAPRRRVSAAGVHLEGGPADGLGEGRVGVRGGQGDQDLHGAGVADGPDLVEQRGDGALHRGLQVAHQQRGLAVVGDGRGGVHPQPGGLLAGEHLVRRPRGRARRARRATAGRTGRRAGSSATARTSGSAGAPTTRSASKARPRSRASSPRAAASSSVTALPTVRAASQARYSARAAFGRELGAAAQHVLGGLLDVAGRALRGDADLLQLDPDRPVAERGEGGLAVAVGERADGGEGAAGPSRGGASRRTGGLRRVGVGGGPGGRAAASGLRGRRGPRSARCAVR